MRHLLILFLLSFSITSWAQRFPSDEWYQGETTLSSGEEVKGQIKYDLELETIQVELNGKINTYNASQVVFFSIKPNEERPNRLFYSLPFRNETGYARPKFFEVITQGEVSLIAREYIARQTQSTQGRPWIGATRFDPMFNPDPLWNNMPVTREFLAYKLFIVNPKGDIRELGNSKKEVLRAFDGYQSDLKKYIKQEKLNMESIADISMLVRYYNKLTS